MKKENTLFVVSIILVFLLAGLCSCKQDFSPENPASNETQLDPSLIDSETLAKGSEKATLHVDIPCGTIPSWEIQTDGYHNIPSGKTKATKAGLKNPPIIKSANNLIVMVCEGLTSELIENSTSKYGELILSSFPVKGTTKSRFRSSSNKLLVDYIRNDQYKTMTGLCSFGDLSSTGMRLMTTSKSDSAAASEIYNDQFMLNPAARFVMGIGDFDDFFSPGSAFYLNEVYKSSGKLVETLADAVPLYKNENVHFSAGDLQHDGKVNKLYTAFNDASTLPSFRQETAFALAWMQSIMDEDGFCLLMSYSPDSSLDANGVQDFDEAVAVAVKYVLENPDTALLICGCPADGSESDVCFFGYGKNVSVKATFYECVTALFD